MQHTPTGTPQGNCSNMVKGLRNAVQSKQPHWGPELHAWEVARGVRSWRLRQPTNLWNGQCTTNSSIPKNSLQE